MVLKLQGTTTFVVEVFEISFLTLHKSWDKIQPTEHLKLNQKVKQTSLRCFFFTCEIKKRVTN